MSAVERTDMRDTGIGWIGAVPTHWVQVPTRAALRISRETVGTRWATTPLLSLTKRGVIHRDIESGEGKFPTSFDDYQIVEPGDLVFCLFDIDETPRTVGLVQDRGMLTGAYTRFVVDRAVADERYLEFYYIAIDDGKRFRPLYTGLRKVIQKQRFLSAPLVLPPLEEQRAIAHYLVEQTAQIDALIARQEDMIRLLAERRVAAVVHRVAGVAALRPREGYAGWIGEVPESWGIERPKWLFTERREANRSHDIHLTPSQKYGVLSQSDYMSASGAQVVLNLTGQDSMKHVEPNDFVSHLRSFQGGLEWSGLAGKVSSAYTIIVPNSRVDPGFMRHVLKCSGFVQTLRSTVFQLRDGQSIRFGDLDKVPLPLPPLAEQRAIADRLDAETTKIDSLIAKTREHIVLAKERRCALIAAAVTGQIDIRTASRRAA